MQRVAGVVHAAALPTGGAQGRLGEWRWFLPIGGGEAAGVLSSSDGAAVEARIWHSGLSRRHLVSRPRMARSWLVRAARRAERWGATVVGLEGLAVEPAPAAAISARVGARVTAGRCLELATAGALVAGLLTTAGQTAASGQAVVVGPDQDGGGAATCVAGVVRHAVLCGARRDRLEAVQTRVLEQTGVSAMLVEEPAAAVADADAVVYLGGDVAAATLATAVVRGTVVVDLSPVGALAAALATRPDVVVADGAVIGSRGGRTTGDLPSWPPALAEAALVAWDGPLTVGWPRQREVLGAARRAGRRGLVVAGATAVGEARLWERPEGDWGVDGR